MLIGPPEGPPEIVPALRLTSPMAIGYSTPICVTDYNGRRASGNIVQVDRERYADDGDLARRADRQCGRISYTGKVGEVMVDEPPTGVTVTSCLPVMVEPRSFNTKAAFRGIIGIASIFAWAPRSKAVPEYVTTVFVAAPRATMPVAVVELRYFAFAPILMPPSTGTLTPRP